MKSSVFVRHKAGKAMPNLRAVLYCIRKLTFAKKVKVTMTFDQSIKGAETGGTVWLKACGWKNGIITKSNHEELVAFRVQEVERYEGFEKGYDYVRRTLEVCEYERYKKKLKFKDIQTLTVPKQLKEISCTIERRGFMPIPCFPWAEGGGKYSLGNYTYWLKIEKVK